MRLVAAVEDVVLQHEEDIEHDGEESQPELGGVAEQRVPVVIVVGDQEHLHHTQHCTVDWGNDIRDLPCHKCEESL